MTKQDFIQYLCHPENLNRQSIGSLEKLVHEYPYFQIGRMLYLKNLHNENSIDYEKNLHITSAYAPSGKVLYNLIKKKVAVTETANQEEPIIANDKQQTTNEPLPQVNSLAPKKEESIKKDDFDELQQLEKEMLREAARSSYSLELSQAQESETQDKVASEVTSATNHQPSTISQSYSFNDWLKVVSGKHPDAAAEEKIVQKKQKNSLIEQFILEETVKATPVKAEFYSAETMAKKSLQDDETFVTETLAKIYLKQGNLPKALRAYEILIVKHPEKSRLFAPLLEKIKKLLKEQKGK